MDGVNRDIYVSNEELLKDLDDNRRVQISDIRYRKWSKKEWTQAWSTYPSEEFRIMEHMGAIVYEYLGRNHETVSFPFSGHGLSNINTYRLENRRPSNHAFSDFFIREDPSENI